MPEHGGVKMYGFESQQHEESIWRALKARVVPLKFAYAGSAAHTHNRLASQGSYQHVAIATDAEVHSAVGLLGSRIADISICEIGPGNGIHTVAFLRAFRQAGALVPGYLGLDFSKELLDILKTRLQHDEPGLATHFHAWDFETEPTSVIGAWRRMSATLLIMMIGHTIGNPESPVSCLRNLYASAQPGDFLLLSAMLRGTDTPANLVQPYLNDVFTAAALEPLRMCGLNLAEGKFRARWDESASSVIGEFVLDIAQSVSHRGETLQFEPGSTIRCFLSRRFQENEIVAILSDAGWVVMGCCLSQDASHVAVTAIRPKSGK